VEKREDEIKRGTGGRLDGKWVEAKEEASERTRDTVLAALKMGNFKDNLLSLSHESKSAESDEASAEDEELASGSSSKATTPPSEPGPKLQGAKSRTFFGFDEDDEFMSSDDDSEGKE